MRCLCSATQHACSATLANKLCSKAAAAAAAARTQSSAAVGDFSLAPRLHRFCCSPLWLSVKTVHEACVVVCSAHSQGQHACAQVQQDVHTLVCMCMARQLQSCNGACIHTCGVSSIRQYVHLLLDAKVEVCMRKQYVRHALPAACCCVCC